MKLIIVFMLFVLSFAREDDSIRFDIIEPPITTDVLDQIDKNATRHFNMEKVAIDARYTMKKAKHQRTIQRLKAKSKTNSKADKLKYQQDLKLAEVEEKNIEKWYKQHLKRIEEEKKLYKIQEESRLRVVMTHQIIKERLDDYVMQNKTNPSQQLSYNIKVMETRLNVSQSQLDALALRRSEQHKRSKDVERVKQQIEDMKQNIKYHMREMNRKIHKAKHQKKYKLLQILKNEKIEMKNGFEQSYFEALEMIHKLKRRNEKIDWLNATKRIAHMNAILSDVKKNQRRFKYLSKRTDICPLVKHQLSKRVKYYKWMLHRTIQHIKQDMASSKRHQTNAHLELEELQELRKGRIQALQQQKESIERHVHNLEIKIIEMQEKHKKVSVKNYKEIMKGYHEKLVLLQIRLKSVHRRLIQIDKNLANSNTNRHKVLRNTLKHLRQKKARYNKIIAANTAKLNFFKNAIRSAKLTSRKVQLTRKTKKFYTVINANRKLLKDVDMLISTKQTEYDLLSSKIIRHEEDKIKHLLAKLLRIKTSIKKKSNMKSHEKNPKTRTSLKHSIHQLKIKSKTIKNSLNHHQKEIASIRRLFAYYVQKDQYQLMNNELSDASNRIEFLNKKIMVLRNRFARMSKGHNVDFEVPSNHFERAVLALKERIGYNENERKELMKEERSIGKKMLFNVQRLLVLTTPLFLEAKKDVGLLNNERSLLLPKVVNETNIFKHKQYLKNMKFTEVKLELAQKEYVHLKHELKHIKRKVAQIKSLLKKPLICKSKGSCPLCLHLGQIMKNGLIKRMNDDMILGKMKRFCSKQKSGLQQMCMESSLKVAQYGFKVSDPYTFDHEQICQKIGMCSL